MEIESIQEADEEHEVEKYENSSSRLDICENRLETEYLDDDEQAYDLYSIEEVFLRYTWIASAWILSLFLYFCCLSFEISLVFPIFPLLVLELSYFIQNFLVFREELQVFNSFFHSIHFMRLLDCLAHIIAYSVFTLKALEYEIKLYSSVIPLAITLALRTCTKVSSPNKCVTFAGIINNVQRWGKLFIVINLSIKLDKFLYISWTVVFWPALAAMCIGGVVSILTLCMVVMNLLSKYRNLNLVYSHFWLLYGTCLGSLVSFLFYFYFTPSNPYLLFMPIAYLSFYLFITLRLRNQLTLAWWEFFVADQLNQNQFSPTSQPLPVPGSQKLFIERAFKNKLSKVISKAPVALVELTKPNIQTKSEKIKRRKLSRTNSQILEYTVQSRGHARSQSSNLAYDFSVIKPPCKFCTVNDGVNKFKECGHGELCSSCADAFLRNKSKCYVCQEEVSETYNEYNKNRNVKREKRFSFADV